MIYQIEMKNKLKLKRNKDTLKFWILLERPPAAPLRSTNE